MLLATYAVAACGPKQAPRPGRPGEPTVLLETAEDGPRARAPRTLPTEYDDQRAGESAASQVAAEAGIVDDPELTRWVSEIGQHLARFAPRRSFAYQFFVIDQFEPNAFALPGGYVYISRGTLALANTEHELANVMGHEITHAARRHAAAQQELARRQSPFAMPHTRMAHLAAYARDLEREADAGGQVLAGHAGYDPMGLADFLAKLRDVERLRFGASRLPGFFDTHPGTTERAAASAVRASQVAVTEGPRSALGATDYLRRIDGIMLGPNPAEGVFQGRRFLHPDLDFQVRFPRGWRLVNTPRAVGARSPDGNAQVFILADKGSDPRRAAETLIAEHVDEFHIRVTEAKEVMIGELKSFRVEATALVGGQRLRGQLSFIPYGGLVYRVVGVGPTFKAGDFLPFVTSTARSFRPLTPEERASIQVLHLDVVEAREGEDLTALGKRTGNAWNPLRTAVLNGRTASARFDGGEPVKIVRQQPYRSAPASGGS